MNIKYSKLDMQPYMKSELFTKDNISFLLSLQSRTVRGIRNDFGEYFKPHLSCPLYLNHLDSLPEVHNWSPKFKVSQNKSNIQLPTQSMKTYFLMFLSKSNQLIHVHNTIEAKGTTIWYGNISILFTFGNTYG